MNKSTPIRYLGDNLSLLNRDNNTTSGDYEAHCEDEESTDSNDPINLIEMLMENGQTGFIAHDLISYDPIKDKFEGTLSSYPAFLATWLGVKVVLKKLDIKLDLTTIIDQI